MDENLQRLAQALRRETCPQRVLDEVARRIAAEKPAPRRLRFAIAGALASVLLLGGVAVWCWSPRGSLQRPTNGAGTATADGAQIVAQATGALGYIGAVIGDATSRSEQIILKGTVPPLRNSLDTARNKIMDHL